MASWFRNLWPFSRRNVHVSSPTLAEFLGFGDTNDAGVPVNSTSALSCMAWWSGVRLLSESLAQLPLRLYRSKGKEAPEEVTDHRTRMVIIQPNGTQTPFNFTQTGQNHVLTHGNMIAEIVLNGKHEPAELWLVDPKNVDIDWGAGKKSLVYKLRDTGATLTQDRVLHVPGLGFDGVRGYDVITVANQAIGLAIGAEKFGARWFAADGRPDGVLEFPGKLTPEAMRRMQKDWDEMTRAYKHATAVLVEGLKYHQFDNDPAKAQALEVRRFQVLEIARLLRVPPHMLFDLDRATFSNIEQQSIEFVTYSLGPWRCAWEQEYDRKLLTPAERMSGLFFRFDVSALMRGDPHNTATSLSKLVNGGIMKPNEARAALDLSHDEDGGKLRIPLNTATADQIDADNQQQQQKGEAA